MKILLCVLICICLCGCDKSIEKNIINSEYINKIVLDKKYVILDVRSEEEYDVLHIKNAINIQVDEINSDIEIDKNNIIFVYCKSGNRSSMAYNKLKELGYTVYDLGGINNIELEKE